MSRSVASLLLAVGIIGRFAPRTVTCAGGHGSAAAFIQHVGQQPPHPETIQETESLRSVELDDFQVEEVSDTTLGNTPIILKLYPPEAKPALLHANLPLRFGRSWPRAAAQMLQSPLNLTRRFGRSPETDSPVALPCHQCPRVGGVALASATLPQRFGRTNRIYSRPARTPALFARGIVAQPRRRSLFHYVDNVREEASLNMPKGMKASIRPSASD